MKRYRKEPYDEKHPVSVPLRGIGDETHMKLTHETQKISFRPLAGNR